MRHYKKIYFLLLLIIFSHSCDSSNEREIIALEMEESLQKDLLNRWYPLAVDKEYGGFLSSFSYDWKPEENQDKMIVTQARHVWSNAKASMRYPDQLHYIESARHGYKFLKDVMWDKEFGGFHTLVDRSGKVISKPGEEKLAYGNAYGIYSLAAYFMATNDTSALNLAKETFLWLEKYSYDPQYLGYFQHMNRDGSLALRTSDLPSTSEIGYKDQNSSIHLLEAFTELYQVWPDPLLRKRLQELLILIRDTITTDEGYMVLFFNKDWTPVSFRDSVEEIIERHHYLDHVSFGHDVETAYLMLEASHILGLENDSITLYTGKKMVDHALKYGWDKQIGGFYDGGYYFKNEQELRIVKDTKNWWAQAEGLNTLLLMAYYFPEDDMQYEKKFYQLWNYVKIYLIDEKNGGWYAGGIDKDPQQRTLQKGHIWKSTYHNFRALDSCVKRLKKKDKAI